MLDDGALAARIVQAARAHLEANFSWSLVARQVEDICERAVCQGMAALD